MVGVASLILPILDVDIGWSFKKSPKKGDHIRVKRQLYYHHGIYVSDTEVIHFSGRNSDGILDWENCEIIVTTLSEFLNGGRLEVRRYLKCEKCKINDEDYIVQKAKSYIGKKGYNLFTNNCEHFANYCTMDKRVSEQVDKLVSLHLPKTLALSFMPRAIFFGHNLGLSLIFAILLSATSMDTESKNTRTKKITKSSLTKPCISNKNKATKSKVGFEKKYPRKEDVKISISVERDHALKSQNLYSYTYIGDEEFDI